MVVPDHVPGETKETLERFLEKLKEWAPPSLEAVVLFGSMARGDFGASSDIDLLIVFDEEDPEARTEDVVGIISSIKPSREIRPVLTNLKDLEGEMLREIAREGIVLYGKIVLSPSNLGLRAYRIISYNLQDSNPTQKQRITRRVHGYTSKKEVDGEERTYEYEGLSDREDCFLLGKGVVAVPENESEKVIDFLERNSAKVKSKQVFL